LRWYFESPLPPTPPAAPTQVFSSYPRSTGQRTWYLRKKEGKRKRKKERKKEGKKEREKERKERKKERRKESHTCV
jgi:hypothetical protein